MALELTRQDSNIIAISEVHFPESNLQEHSTGYTLYWLCKSEIKRHLSGTDFMVKNSIASNLKNLPIAHSEHIISMYFPLQNEQHAILFSVNAPILQINPAKKNVLY